VKALVIFGAGRHSLVVKDCLTSSNHRLIGHIDDFGPTGGELDGLPILGSVAGVPNIAAREGGLCGIVAIGANHIRRDMVARVEALIPDFEWISAVHHSAIISSSAQVATGSVIVAGSIINCFARIGAHSLINTGSRIDHDTVFGDYSSTGPGVVTGGNATVGTGSHIGIGAILSHGVSVGDHCIIGGGSFVIDGAESHSVYYGTPARRIRGRYEGQAYL
jgi:acetyltransferase EpsM